MTSLKELQERFQAGILAGDDTILGDVKDSAREDRTVLFGVYRYAYGARLVEILGNDYPQLHAYLGDEGFAKLATAYVAAHPSDQRNARWYGRHLPGFAKETEPFAAHPELSEIAALEKALDDAFDGPDATPLALTDLAAVPPEDWPRLTLTPHPTVILLRFTTNAADIWAALKDERTPPAPARLPEPQAVAVWRQGLMARFRPLDAEEAMMWNEAAKGVPFGGLCEMVATFAGEDEAELRAATYLKTWIETDMLMGCQTQQPLGDAQSGAPSFGAGNKASLRPVSQ
jgi:Putative DNA-binding domain